MKFKLQNLLKIALILSVFGTTIDTWLHGDSINSFLFLNLNLSDNFATGFSKIFSLITLIVCLLNLYSDYFKKLLWVPFSWFLSIAITTTLLHSSFGYEVSLLTKSMRYLLPLIILYGFNTKKSILFFKIAISTTFIGHGIEAMLEHPVFMDYLFDFFSGYLNVEPSLSTVRHTLFIIGLIDILMALTIWFNRNNFNLTYFFIWGLITALERIDYMGINGIYDFLMRAPHFFIPLSFLIYNIFKDKNFSIQKQDVSI